MIANAKWAESEKLNLNIIKTFSHINYSWKESKFLIFIFEEQIKLLSMQSMKIIAFFFLYNHLWKPWLRWCIYWKSDTGPFCKRKTSTYRRKNTYTNCFRIHHILQICKQRFYFISGYDKLVREEKFGSKWGYCRDEG